MIHCYFCNKVVSRYNCCETRASLHARVSYHYWESEKSRKIELFTSLNGREFFVYYEPKLSILRIVEQLTPTPSEDWEGVSIPFTYKDVYFTSIEWQSTLLITPDNIKEKIIELCNL